MKTGIAWGLLALIPLMAAAGLSGRRLAGTSRAPVIQRKLRRMKLVGANAAGILIPSVLALYWLVSHGRFGWPFVAVQAVELAAGTANIILLGLNMRDGLRMHSARTRGAHARTRAHAKATPSPG